MEFVQSPYFNQIVKNRLIKLGVNDVNKLLSILIDNHAVIAGSFPLQCLLGEEYIGSDVDIFYKLGESVDKGRPEPLDYFIYKSYNLKGIPESYLINGIIKTRKYKVTDKLHFNLINTLKDPLVFIKENFDLSFCQTYFDGINMYFRPLTLIKKGFIVSYPVKKEKKQYHVSKQKNKPGSSSDLNNLYPDNIESQITSNLEERIKKYKERGFIIVETSELLFEKYILNM